MKGKYVDITGIDKVGNKRVVRAFSKLQVWTLTNMLSREGYCEIILDFDICDSLY